MTLYGYGESSYRCGSRRARTWTCRASGDFPEPVICLSRSTLSASSRFAHLVHFTRLVEKALVAGDFKALNPPQD